MATANIYTYIEITGAGPVLPLGSKTVPLSISLDTNVEALIRTRHHLTTATAKEVLRTGTADGDDIAAPFKLIALLPEVDTEIVFIGGTTADSSNFTIEAGHLFVLSSGLTTDYQTTYADRLSSGAATAENITKVYALQSSGSTKYIDVLASY